jgi:hypothetical protein
MLLQKLGIGIRYLCQASFLFELKHVFWYIILPNFDKIGQKPLINGFCGVCHITFAFEISFFQEPR